MIERANGRMTVPQIFIGTSMSAAATTSTRSSAQASSIRCSPAKAAARMSATPATFKAGADPDARRAARPRANLDAAVPLIGEAKAAGADYVQTPEMTNIMEVSASSCSPPSSEEDDDASLATFRELARKLGDLHLTSARWRSRSRRRRPPTAAS